MVFTEEVTSAQPSLKVQTAKNTKVSHWTGGNTAVLTDGSTITFEKGNITEADGSTTTMVEYDVTGIKYVPVKVAAADYEDFCKTYAVVENGMDLTGDMVKVSLLPMR